MEVMKEIWSIEDSVKYVKVVRGGTAPMINETGGESIVFLDSSGKFVNNKVCFLLCIVSHEGKSRKW